VAIRGNRHREEPGVLRRETVASLRPLAQDEAKNGCFTLSERSNAERVEGRSLAMAA